MLLLAFPFLYILLVYNTEYVHIYAFYMRPAFGSLLVLLIKNEVGGAVRTPFLFNTIFLTFPGAVKFRGLDFFRFCVF